MVKIDVWHNCLKYNTYSHKQYKHQTFGFLKDHDFLINLTKKLWLKIIVILTMLPLWNHQAWKIKFISDKVKMNTKHSIDEKNSLTMMAPITPLTTIYRINTVS